MSELKTFEVVAGDHMSATVLSARLLDPWEWPHTTCGGAMERMVDGPLAALRGGGRFRITIERIGENPYAKDNVAS